MRARSYAGTGFERVFFAIIAVCLPCGVAICAPPPTPQDSEARQIFVNQVKPLFQAKCQGCHGPTKVSGLTLENREGLLQGGKRGPAIAPGDPAKSVLVDALEQQGSLKMPPGGKLTDKEVAAVRRWIELGAPWSDAPAAIPPAAGENAGDLW